MTTGMIRPAISLFCVRALNCLQNSMMFTCAWPRAGPTGGAGVALPASIWSFTWVAIFFVGGISKPFSFLLPARCWSLVLDTSVFSVLQTCYAGQTAASKASGLSGDLFYLAKVQLHRR